MLNDASSPALLAYQVDEPSEGHSVIVFAASSAEARRRGAGHFDLDFSEVERCRRANYFDSYAPGPVPTQALLDAGWWFECAHCTERVTLDRDDDQSGPPAEEPCVRGEFVYCGPKCLAAHHVYHRLREAAQNALVELVTTRYPTATHVHVHVFADKLEKVGEREAARSRATFNLPGLKYPVTYHFGHNCVLVSQCDVDQYHALYGATRTTDRQP